MRQQVITYPSLLSTNIEAARLLLVEKRKESFFVVSDFQENGKGQKGNEWISDAGKNLLMSWVVFPAFLSVHLQFQLSKAVSLAITDLLEEYSISSMIKWPNDIVCRGKKISGILIENSLMGSVIRSCIIGIGLNINQLVFPVFPYQAVSMAMIAGRSFELNEIRDRLIEKLEHRYDMVKSGETDKLNENYLDKLFRLNEESLFSKSTGEFNGIIRGVSEMGELVVESENKISRFGFHEIKLIY